MAEVVSLISLGPPPKAKLTPEQAKSRKSVAFTDNQSGDSSTAESHSLPSGESAGGTAGLASTANGTADKEVEDVTKMFEGMTKKKKSSSKKTTSSALKDEAAEDSPAPGSDAGDFDLSLMKKKKKKPKAPAAETTDDFEAKLAKAGAAEEAAAAAAGSDPTGGTTTTSTSEASAAAPTDEAKALEDLASGTGIWAHDATAPISYTLLLARFFDELHNKSPDSLGVGGARAYKIPPPQCLREGNKKTIFANIPDICKKMGRSEEHVTSFLFAELGTSGSVDGSRRLVIKGRFQQKQIENVIRRYIIEYVTCKTCRSPDTDLSKGENRLYFITCKTCGSRRSVTAVKTGFTAQVGKRRRQQG